MEIIAFLKTLHRMWAVFRWETEARRALRAGDICRARFAAQRADELAGHRD